MFLPWQTTINALQFFGGVVQEKESKMGFYCRWAFPTRGMTLLGGTEAMASVPLSTVIPRTGNAHLQQNSIFGFLYSSFLRERCTLPVLYAEKPWKRRGIKSFRYVNVLYCKIPLFRTILLRTIQKWSSSDSESVFINGTMGGVK